MIASWFERGCSRIVGKDFDFKTQVMSEFNKPAKTPIQPVTNYAKEHMQRSEPTKLGGIGANFHFRVPPVTLKS